MLDLNDPNPVKSAANDLNNLLQVIGDSAHSLRGAVGSSPEADKHFDIIHDCVQRGAATIRMMLDDLAKAGGVPPVGGERPSATKPAFTSPVQSGMRAVSDDLRVANPEGALELVMIVDDEQLINTQAERVLTSQGYRVIAVTDPLRALTIYRRLHKEIDLIILDFTMPVMDGSEVFDELRTINPRVPVMLSSGFAEQDKLKAMLAKGLRGFLPKPYTHQKLIAQVRSTLDALKRERLSQQQ
jgi:CheY-like chemotaxis protein